MSVLTLSAISIERWYAICRPLSFNSTAKRARIIIAGIWLFSFAISVPELVVNFVKPRFDAAFTMLLTQCLYSWGPESEMVYRTVLLVLLYVWPLLLMSVAYSLIADCLWSNTIPGVDRNWGRQNGVCVTLS